MRHGRRRITWKGTALVIGGVIAGCALVTYVPQGGTVEDPFVVDGDIGETLDLTYAELTVTDVRVADSVANVSEAALAGGTYLVVDVTWRATQGETTFSGAEVTDAQGRRFWPAGLAGCAVSAKSQPGYSWHTTYCFDVPRDALAGATVRLARGDQAEEHAGQRRDAVAVVDLGITQDEVTQLWDAKETVTPDEQGIVSADTAHEDTAPADPPAAGTGGNEG